MRQVCAKTDTGKVRPNNEDAYLVDQDTGVYLLADGMGGARGGERASHLAVETVAEVLRAKGQAEASVLLEAVETANERIYTEGHSDAKLEGMGTTLVAAIDLGESFAIASVGDSRAYLCQGDQVRAITEDQSWVNDFGVPMGLDAEAIRKHPMRHVLTMALGVSPSVDVRYYKVPVTPGSMLLLSSDGLHGVIPHGTMETILRENGAGKTTPEEKCDLLIQAARQAGGPDNITVILIRIP